jgi:hypothetical protein
MIRFGNLKKPATDWFHWVSVRDQGPRRTVPFVFQNGGGHSKRQTVPLKLLNKIIEAKQQRNGLKKEFLFSEVLWTDIPNVQTIVYC